MGELDDFINSLHIPIFGYTDFRMLEAFAGYYEQRPEGFANPFEQINPAGRLRPLPEEPELTNIISLGFPYAFSTDVKYPAFSLYTRGRDYHQVIRPYLLKVAEFITARGYRAKIQCDASPLPERLIAFAAGLGSLGRNHHLINPEYGSYIFLGEVLTDMALDVKPRVLRASHIKSFDACGSCRNCITACPARILGFEYCDTTRCLAYITQKKQLAIEEIKSLGGRLFGCDTCQIVCPCNEGKANTGMAEFAPLPYMAEPNLDEIARLSKRDFIKYRMVSAGWRGKGVLQRNAAIALAQTGKFIAPDGVKSDKLKAELIKIEKLYKDG